MFGLLNTTQIYGIQQHHQHQHHDQESHIPQLTSPSNTSAISSQTLNHTTTKSSSTTHRRCYSSVSDSSHKFFSNLASKNPTNFIEKFLKTDLLSTYDSIKNYRNFPNTNQNSTTSSQNKRYSDPLFTESTSSKLSSFNCLHGSYRHSFDGEFYDRVKVNNNLKTSDNKNSLQQDLSKSEEMTIKCSKNLLAVDPVEQGPATLQNYQKIPESEHDLLVDSLVASSGASSGEFNSSSDATTNTTTGNSSSNSISSSLSSSNLYKRLSFGGRNSQNTKQEKNGENNAQAQQQQQDGVTDNSITLNLTSSIIPTLKVIDLQRSSSSTSSSGDFLSKRDRKKGAMTPQPEKTPLHHLLASTTNSSSSSSTTPTNNFASISPEKAQRRKLLQVLANYDQQNKILQRELMKEKRRRTEELACVVKSLLCFESKLKNDMKTVNQRLQEKDGEICRLVRQNRALRKKLCKLQEEARECAQDEGVVEDGDNEEGDKETKELLEDCLVLEALQCNNCRKQFYDIEVKDNCSQTGVGSGSLKENNGSRNNDDPTTEHGSSSDDTVSSSFFGARRSVRYTSKRTSGTFRDYMRSRAMNIDDPALEAELNSEEYPSTISRDDSQIGYEKLNIYSRTMERMHGVKSESERDSEQSGLDTVSSVTRSNSRASTKSSKSTISTATSKASEMSQNLEEDDGIFSPTQDEDFEEELEGKLKIVRGRALEAFSEASPKQIYETSTDDWYASASDQEEIEGTVGAKSYGQGAVNPVLECVNQILLQQSMEGVEERSQTPKNSTTLPRRSSLSDRRHQRCNSRASDGATPNSRNGTLTRKRVHFSTKNSMVHVPRNDETEEDDEEESVSELKTNQMISSYQGMSAYITHSPALDSSGQSERLETFNYESIYSNEYEPIGSELNSSNLYVDMETTNNKTVSNAIEMNNKCNKLPPALPPKPANLLKFKKSLQQLDESPDELIEAHNSEVMVEPDYCSISEVNVGITSVQIRADIHRAPLSERDLESVIEQENDLDAATVISEAASQKTEEIEEIFADIPKLPNVAAIIAPKSSLKQNDYLIMTPKTESNNSNKMSIMGLAPTNTSTPNGLLNMHGNANNKPDRSSLKLNITPINGLLNGSCKSPKQDCVALRPQISSANYQQQYKRKHMPNILQEINKRLSLPNSPITPTTPKTATYGKSSSNDSETLTSLPLQAEFDWYNLDAEYGKHNPSDLPKVNESLNTVMPTLLADIKEDGESLITTADEYNLDEEYNNEIEQDLVNESKTNKLFDSDTLCEAINPSASKAKKIKKNLANFEKFIENTSLTTKPLPSKRKIYFAGPFV